MDTNWHIFGTAINPISPIKMKLKKETGKRRKHGYIKGGSGV
jgi:hypothetical protein